LNRAVDRIPEPLLVQLVPADASHSPTVHSDSPSAAANIQCCRGPPVTHCYVLSRGMTWREQNPCRDQGRAWQHQPFHNKTSFIMAIHKSSDCLTSPPPFSVVARLRPSLTFPSPFPTKSKPRTKVQVPETDKPHFH